jgi:hypothetical protein
MLKTYHKNNIFYILMIFMVSLIQTNDIHIHR